MIGEVSFSASCRDVADEVVERTTVEMTELRSSSTGFSPYVWLGIEIASAAATGAVAAGCATGAFCPGDGAAGEVQIAIWAALAGLFGSAALWDALYLAVVPGEAREVTELRQVRPIGVEYPCQRSRPSAVMMATVFVGESSTRVTVEGGRWTAPAQALHLERATSPRIRMQLDSGERFDAELVGARGAARRPQVRPVGSTHSGEERSREERERACRSLFPDTPDPLLDLRRSECTASRAPVSWLPRCDSVRDPGPRILCIRGLEKRRELIARSDEKPFCAELFPPGSRPDTDTALGSYFEYCVIHELSEDQARTCLRHGWTEDRFACLVALQTTDLSVGRRRVEFHERISPFAGYRIYGSPLGERFFQDTLHVVELGVRLLPPGAVVGADLEGGAPHIEIFGALPIAGGGLGDPSPEARLAVGALGYALGAVGGIYGVRARGDYTRIEGDSRALRTVLQLDYAWTGYGEPFGGLTTPSSAYLGVRYDRAEFGRLPRVSEGLFFGAGLAFAASWMEMDFRIAFGQGTVNNASGLAGALDLGLGIRIPLLTFCMLETERHLAIVPSGRVEMWIRDDEDVDVNVWPNFAVRLSVGPATSERGCR